jgi:hypothetical protein
MLAKLCNVGEAYNVECADFTEFFPLRLLTFALK